MGYLQSTQSEVEKKLYAEKIQQLEEKKQELEKEKETVLEREANARAGMYMSFLTLDLSEKMCIRSV